MNGGFLSILKPCHLILHDQLSSLEFRHAQAIGKRVGHLVGELALECLVFLFELRKFRYKGHMTSFWIANPSLVQSVTIAGTCRTTGSRTPESGAIAAGA